jgi:hypothetical protein
MNESGTWIWGENVTAEEYLRAFNRLIGKIIASSREEEMTQTTVVADLQARIAELEAKNKELTQALADLDEWICIAEELDFLLDEYGRSTEPMTPKAEEVRDWMQVHVIKPQERIAELEKLAVVWHKYPDEKPPTDGRYLFWDSDGNAPHVLPYNDIVVRDHPGVFSTQTHWAGISIPPEEK